MTADEAKIEINFTVRQRIERPPAEVFQAVVDPDKLCRYFTKTADGGSCTKTCHDTLDIHRMFGFLLLFFSHFLPHIGSLARKSH